MMIDFVLPWVDGNDHVWQKKREKYDPRVDNYNSGLMRYRDWGTLRYVLRGIEKNCPWYRKIFLITEGHRPEWLDFNHPKIQLVTHQELYFHREDLPTFSSPSIEMNLANLKGLSDYFVYMNDDLLILRPVSTERFFRNNLPVDFFCHGWLPRNTLFEKIRGMNSWAHSIKNNIDLINQVFSVDKIDNKLLFHDSYSVSNKISNFLFKYFYKKILWIEHYHQPIPYLRSTLLDVRHRFEREMTIASKNRFRSNNDLNQYLYRYWQLVHGKFTPSKFKDHVYIKIQNEKDCLKAIRFMDRYTFVCANDSVDDSVDSLVVNGMIEKLTAKLEEKLPDKASFEI